jgi:chromosome segregation ATPase
MKVGNPMRPAEMARTMVRAFEDRKEELRKLRRDRDRLDRLIEETERDVEALGDMAEQANAYGRLEA